MNLPWDQERSCKKFGPNRFSCLDGYRLQTNKQTDKQASKVYIKIQSYR